MSITYWIAIDKNDNGDFTNLGESITADILEAKWYLGMSEPDDTVADVGQATVIVRNHQQQFSPDITTNLIGKAFRIQSDDGNTIRTHFSGFVQRIIPQAGNQGTKLATIIAYSRDYTLRQNTIQLPLLLNLSADEAIHAIIDQAQWRYAFFEGYCIIGRDSIGSSDIFPDDAFARHFDTGISEFEFIGDDWSDGYPAHRAIQQFTEGEDGRFFFDREGRATFYNRHHLLNNPAIAATFTDDISDMVYHYGDVTNHITIQLKPRRVGDLHSILWSLEQPIRLEVNTRIEVIARYNIDGEAVGATAIDTPLQAYTDYQAMDNAQQQDMTTFASVTLLEIGSSATTFEIANQATRPIYLTQLILRGTPLILGDPLTLSQSIPDSIVLYGKHTKQVDVPVISDIEDAIGLANWALQRQAYPRGYVREITTTTRTHPTETLALTLYDLIAISEQQTGHHETYAIIREAHVVDKGGTHHRVTWLLEAADVDFFFTIGTHTIGDTSVVLVPR